MSDTAQDLPYRVAVLCYLHDQEGRLLLLHREKSPNAGQYSPIGGKLDLAAGESPHACAVREIREESGVELAVTEVRLCGLVAECGYEGCGHWLIFIFEVDRAIGVDEIPTMEIAEGVLEWVPVTQVANLDIPDTDRKVLWPLMSRAKRGFFTADIDCSVDPFEWTVHESATGG